MKRSVRGTYGTRKRIPQRAGDLWLVALARGAAALGEASFLTIFARRETEVVDWMYACWTLKCCNGFFDYIVDNIVQQDDWYPSPNSTGSIDSLQKVAEILSQGSYTI